VAILNVASPETIRKAVASLNAVPSFQTREIRLDPAVLVIGSGEPARHAASRLAELGHPVTVVGAPAPFAAKAASHPNGKLERLEGHVGEFRALVASPSGRTSIECGAVLVAEAAGPSPDALAALSSRFPSRSVVALSALEGVVATLPREQRVRSVGIVLDLEIEESKAGSEAALETARRLQRVGVAQVALFAHDLRVAAPGLQELYDAARNDGVVVVKYDGRLAITTDGEAGARIRCRDAGLDAQTEYACDLVGISAWGIADPAEGARELAAALGVGCDALGRLQENNIHLLPVLTGRTGVFVAGSPRGQHYLRDALLETEAAVAATHALLAPGSLTVELSQAVVDEDKCALCLTCIRACPHRAMGIDAEKKIAQADAAACRRCGICAGECPAKAITLPAYSDDALLVQLAVARRSHA